MFKLISALTIALYFIKRIWDEWNIIGALLFSLMLQSFLTLVSPFRKSTRNRRLIVVIWCAYLIADAAANFAIGLISNSQRKPLGHGTPSPSVSQDDAHILAFWAPFLLLHLGCPDPITAFSLEDNELWRRHMLSLIVQAIASLYVFVQSLSDNKLQVATLLMFIAGVIKYSERIWALYQASLDRFRDSILQDPDPGPDYALLMRKYASMRKANLPTTITLVPEPEREAKEVKQGKLSDLEAVHYAYHFFQTFKGLVVDLMFGTRKRKESRDFFTARKGEDALRVLEVELNFIYEDVFYTKMKIMHTWAGYIFLFVALASILAALGLFHFQAKESKFSRINVRITYILLLGAVTMEVIAILMLIFSDWTFASFMDWNHVPLVLKPVTAIFCCLLRLKRPRWSKSAGDEVLDTLMFRRWSGSVPGHNFIRYCLKSSPTTMHELPSWWSSIAYVKLVRDAIAGLIPNMRMPVLPNLKLFRKISLFFSKVARKIGLQDFLDEMAYVSHEPLTKHLWDFVFEELKLKSETAAASPEMGKRICSSRGELALISSCYYDNNDIKLGAFVSDEVEYDERILLWHIATDLCYHNGSSDQTSSQQRVTTKLLSDYMLYLLVMRPSLMSTVVGLAKIRFQDTLAEVKRLFKRSDDDDLRPESEGDLEAACSQILGVNTDVRPVCLKGDRSKSVLFDACMLAKELNKLEDEKWFLMSQVWVELLSYAATHCRPSAHVEQIGKGGELVTFVWLLVAHFGLGHYFQTNTIAKLIIGK